MGNWQKNQHNQGEYRIQAKTLLRALLSSSSQEADRAWRTQLRRLVSHSMAHGSDLGLSEASDLAPIMQRCNERSRMLGFL